jgi:hypothetical protein
VSVTEILLQKLLNGQLASFVRAEGEAFIVSVNGQELAISREVWWRLPEQTVEEKDRILDFHHHRRDRSK